ncbi:MAG TPA: oligosaccharide flippase family protein, partial [Ardenticatenaceae bacterium]|nr:oligosaccharide flippase family protein [Ardenticatenaceae bacterium]
MTVAPAPQALEVGAPVAPAASSRLRQALRLAAPALFFLALPLALFWQSLLPGRTLIPFDNLYSFLPWSAFAEQVGAGTPHNELISDLLLENYAWKLFIRAQITEGQLPLWNPHQFAGLPFLAAGQHSALYPLSLLFLVLPVPQAYGWFTVLSLTWAGLSAYFLLRVLGRTPAASLLGGLVFQGSGFLTVSVVFPMIVAAAGWLPFILAMVARLAQKAGDGERHPTAYLPWASLGALGLGALFLAGHVEIAYYVLLVSARWGRWLLLRLARKGPFLLWGAALAGVGLLLGAAQLVPLFEFVRFNFRSGSASLSEVLGWAWPLRQITSFLVPDFWGNPARHEFFNLASRSWEPIRTLTPTSGAPAPLDYVAWTKGLPSYKNYVEAGGYLGILPLLLAALAISRGWRDRTVQFFAGLGGLSLLFIFGTPAYALLYYGLPGWNQLHTPFRWIFPLTLAVAVLAVTGLDALRIRALPRARARLVLAAGILSLAGLLAVFLLPAPFLRLASALMARSELTRLSFGENSALLVSYQWENLLWLALALLGAGAVLHLASREPTPQSTRAGAQHSTLYAIRFTFYASRPPWLQLALLVVALDLFIASAGFMPVVSTGLANFTPPAIEFLLRQRGDQPWRFTTLDSDGTLGVPESKILNANSGMFYGLEDVRGYDSIIPKHYTEFMSAIEDQTGSLLQNRVGPLFWNGSLESALLDLLGVRYVLTAFELDQAGWTEVYDGEVRIYENADPLPRAFVVGLARTLDRGEVVAALRSLDPRALVLVEPQTGPPLPRDALRAGRAQSFTPARIVRYGANEVEVEVATTNPGWLVLADTWFPGWKAFLRQPGDDRESEREVPIYRADGAFRAINLPPGEWVVRFKYSPDSIRIGFFASFLGAALLALGAAFWAWGRVYQEQPGEHEVRRVAKNSLAPMALSLLNKGVDTVFAAFMARVLGPAGIGAYAFAVSIIWYFIIFTNFGLGTLLTREVARDRTAAAAYLAATIRLRMLLFALATPLLIAVIVLWEQLFGLERWTSWAILLLAVGLIPSNLADALTAVFRAYEKFEIPALISTLSTFIKVGLGAGVLIAGYGIVGLAATSVITNLATLLLLAALLFRSSLLDWPTLRPSSASSPTLPPPAEHPQPSTLNLQPSPLRQVQGGLFNGPSPLLRTAFPLMLNDFLAVAFFRLDKLILQPVQGTRVVGLYDIPYKFIDGLNIIPSTFTLAIFPVMARYAESRDQSGASSLLRVTVLALRWLILLALPLALLTTRYAEPIVLAFGGREFAEHGSTLALQILIWFLPFSFINSLVHYVLIAANQQHALTRAFVV